MDDLYARARELASVSAREPIEASLASARERKKSTPPASTREHASPARESVGGSLVVGFDLAALGVGLGAFGCVSCPVDR